MDITQAEDFVTSLGGSQSFRYFYVASFVVLVYNYVLTIDEEIQFIWNTKWSAVKILCLLTRYLPFCQVIVLLVYAYTPTYSAAVCNILYQVVLSGTVCGVAVAEILLTLRVWAVWGKSKKITGLIASIYLIFLALGGILLSRHFESSHFSEELLVLANTCLNTSPTQFARIISFLLAFYDTILLIILGIKALPVFIFKTAGVKTMTWVVYTDGLLFYICSIILVVVNGSLPDGFVQCLSSLAHVLISILAYSSIMHIREIAYITASGPPKTRQTTMSFAVPETVLCSK